MDVRDDVRWLGTSLLSCSVHVPLTVCTYCARIAAVTVKCGSSDDCLHGLASGPLFQKSRMINNVNK